MSHFTPYRRAKIALIGAGNIGGTLAHLIMQRQLADTVLIDIDQGIPQGKALDINQASAIDGLAFKVDATSDMAAMANADVTIVTAGSARKPGMSRDDLLRINVDVMQSVGKAIGDYCPHTFVIVVTNPLDAMVWVMQQACGLPPQRVVGQAGVLDSGRFTYLLAETLQVSVKDINSFVLGGHGDLMVPVLNYTSIAGIPLKEWINKGFLSQETLDHVIQRVRQGGGEIVNLLKNGSAYFAPASAALVMAESYLYNQRRIVPCAAYLTGDYGFHDIYAGVPAIIGKNGVESIIELSLTPEEQAAFTASVEGVRRLIDDVKNLPNPPKGD